MSSYRVISSDNHVVEPADLWTSRGESRFKDRMPYVEPWTAAIGGSVRACSHGPLHSWSQAGVRFEEPDKLKDDAAFEDVRPGGYIPEEHVKDMDLDGVDVSIIYPTLCNALFISRCRHRASKLRLPGRTTIGLPSSALQPPGVSRPSPS